MFKNIDINIYIAALLSMLSTLFVQFIIEKAKELGKVDLYVKLVHTKSKTFDYGFGFYEDEIAFTDNENEIFIYIPIYLDAVNNCKKPKVIRDINLRAYRYEIKIGDFMQVNKLEDIENNNETVCKLGDDESYTFTVSPSNASRKNLEFVLIKSQIVGNLKDFNRITLTYYDEKNKFHEYDFLTVEECWSLGEIKKTEKEEKWIDLKNLNRR